jgi:hypothetical protein
VFTGSIRQKSISTIFFLWHLLTYLQALGIAHTDSAEQRTVKEEMSREFKRAERLAKHRVRHIVEGYGACKVSVSRRGHDYGQQMPALMMQLVPQEEMLNGVYEAAEMLNGAHGVYDHDENGMKLSL